LGAVSQTDYIGDFMTRPAATQAIVVVVVVVFMGGWGEGAISTI